MTKMQASEIEQLDNKSFNRWCEVSLPKVYWFYALICLRDFSAKFAEKKKFAALCSAQNHVFDPCSSIIEYSFQHPTMKLTVNSTN